MNNRKKSVAERNIEEMMEFINAMGLWGKIKVYWLLAMNIILQRLMDFVPFTGIKVFFLRLRGAKVGKNVLICDKVHFDEFYCSLITIEDNVSIGVGSNITAHSNPGLCEWLKDHYFPRKVAPVHIKEGAWLSTNITVILGVTIGKRAAIGAGSVIIRDIPDYTVAAGVPAKPIKTLDSNVDENEMLKQEIIRSNNKV